ncbi:PLP-dependent aminotransferase family protein [Geomonas sp. Red32]|uniref:aminotransferase-like domain-containing protein n=1 Tax=Geomonas sp. Red32 TaxID=2912856 RepID=UPI00202CC6A7|nr:PLP-dependent aminotransferase family protein [Geomonas sp. Red32]MCM0080270.1 PLP-dependent aminotransferase family protein [Geomonas sp. Red32]
METMIQSNSSKVPLYEEVAGKVSHLIEEGTFGPGSRIPSVRALSRQLSVSINTVMEAYGLLEDRRLIEARPQSGYYVLARRGNIPAEPSMSTVRSLPTKVSIKELSSMIMRDMRDRSLVPLGAAIPNPEHLPIDRLNRMLSTEARRYREQSVSYESPPGCEKLRVQVARRLVYAGCTLTPDQIVTTCGCMEAVNLALLATCRPGDTVAIESPSYYNFLQALELYGLKALEIPTHPRDGMSIDALRYALEHNRISACLAVTNFSNPLGCLMPDDRKKELVELLSSHQVPLIEDDLNGDLSFSPERPRVAKSYDKDGSVLLCSSFSKTLAPGYRVGWIAPGRYQSEIERLKGVITIADATPPQLAIAEFLANGGYDHHLRSLRRIHARQTMQMAQAVGRYFPEGTRISNPAGGFVLWVEFPSYVDSLVLYEQALKAGITIAPGPAFSPRQKYQNCIRLNAGYWSEEVERAIQTLGELAAAMK